MTTKSSADELGGEGPPALRPQDFSAVNDWPGYFGAVLGKPPRDTLLAALAAFEHEGVTGFAVDLAAGEGRDTLELLARGWRVLATDAEVAAFDYLWPRVPAAARDRLTTAVAPFEDTALPPCDLLNASFALPFCAPGHLPALWERIVAAIRPGGRFAGQFFGDRDSWASRADRTHHTHDEVVALLAEFDIEVLRIEERDDPPDGRDPKHWHLFHVVARKR
jgi:tellurite methyltransferase